MCIRDSSLGPLLYGAAYLSTVGAAISVCLAASLGLQAFSNRR